MSLVDGIAQHIPNLVDDATYGPGGNVFVHHMPQQPDLAIAVYSYGGAEADTKLGYDSPNLQIKVRGAPGGALAPEAIAQSIYDGLHGVAAFTLPGGTELEDCIGVQSGPVALGVDDDRRHEFAINFRTEIRNTTTRD